MCISKTVGGDRAEDGRTYCGDDYMIHVPNFFFKKKRGDNKKQFRFFSFADFSQITLGINISTFVTFNIFISNLIVEYSRIQTV